MPTRITVKDPEYYLKRISTGCILDPSIFYSGEYVDATIEVIGTASPPEIYLPSNLFRAIKESSWRSFSATLTLWSGNYERLPDAWRKRQKVMSELRPLPIEIPEKGKRIKLIFDTLAEDRKLSPLYQVVFELTAYSYLKSIPVYAGSHPRFRFLELLDHRLQTIVVEPAGRWARQKKEYLSGMKLRIPLFAMGSMGGAFVFMESLQTGSLGGMGGGDNVISATIINGDI